MARGKSGALECHVLFLGLLLGGANVKKRGEEQDKEFSMDNTVFKP